MKTPKVLIACEESQAVTIEMRKLGIEAYSCDVQDCSGGHFEWHIKEDVLPLLNGNCKFHTCDGLEHEINGKWDMVIAFPPCTHLAVSGARSSSHKTCWEQNSDDCDYYYPLFWHKDSDKIDYENYYDILHSACYNEYGMKRTGCVCCPYSRYLEYELSITEKYEPKLFKAVNNIFGESYEYTKKYRTYQKQQKELEKKNK